MQHGARTRRDDRAIAHCLNLIRRIREEISCVHECPWCLQDQGKRQTESTPCLESEGKNGVVTSTQQLVTEANNDGNRVV